VFVERKCGIADFTIGKNKSKLKAWAQIKSYGFPIRELVGHVNKAEFGAFSYDLMTAEEPNNRSLNFANVKWCDIVNFYVHVKSDA